MQISKGRLSINDEPLKYEKITGDGANSSEEANKTNQNDRGRSSHQDNPNPELFDIYQETSQDTHWRVIFQKQPEDKDFGPFVVPPGRFSSWATIVTQVTTRAIGGQFR